MRRREPIILLAIVGIAGGAMGVGFLGNDISLDVQLLGVGETNLASPIMDATVKFNVEQFPGDLGFKNIIADCIIQSPQEIVQDSKVFCKLTDEHGNVAAEGSRILSSTLPAHTPTVIPIDDPQKIASQVTNIHDVILVVQGPSLNP